MDGRVLSRIIGLVLLLAALQNPAAALAQNPFKEVGLIRDATAELSDFLNSPTMSIPPAAAAQAQGIAIFPEIIKAGFLVGARHGQGVLLVRRDDGTWSHPLFVNLTSGSIGLQAGVESSDLVLLFMNRESINRFLIGKGMLGLNTDASVAAGPTGTQVGSATNLKLTADILAFGRNRGVFAGLSAGGTSVAMSRKRNLDFYGSLGVNPGEIIRAVDLPMSRDVANLLAMADRLAGTPVEVIPAPGPEVIVPDGPIPGEPGIEVLPDHDFGPPAPTGRRVAPVPRSSPAETPDPIPPERPAVNPPRRDELGPLDALLPPPGDLPPKPSSTPSTSEPRPEVSPPITRTPRTLPMRPSAVARRPASETGERPVSSPAPRSTTPVESPAPRTQPMPLPEPPE